MSLLGFILISITGCGNKGNLYMPEKKTDTTTKSTKTVTDKKDD